MAAASVDADAQAARRRLAPDQWARRGRRAVQPLSRDVDRAHPHSRSNLFEASALRPILNALLAFQSAEECTAARAHILQASQSAHARPLTVGAQTASLPDLKDPSVQLFALQLLLDPRFARFVKQSGEFYDSVNTAITGDAPASRPGPSQSPSTEPAR